MRRPSAYRVFLTRNSEYHVRASICLGVRDRRSGAFLAGHPAVGRRLSETFVAGDGKVRSLRVPSLGDTLEFVSDDDSLETSPILDIEEREAIGPAGPFGVKSCAPSPLSRRPARPVRVTPAGHAR